MLIEPDTGSAFRRVTFSWSEAAGEAAVQDVLVRLIALTDYAQDDGRLEPFLLDRGSDGVWSRTLRLPADLRTSYQLCPVRDGSLRDGAIDEDRWASVMAAGITDPTNPAAIPAGCTYGNPGPASVLELPDALPMVWRAPRPGVPAGKVTRHALGTSVVQVYEAPGVTSDAPLVVLFDGRQWLDLDVTAMLDSLVTDDLLKPMVVVLIESIGGAERRYHGLTRGHLFMPLLTNLLEFIDARDDVTRDPARSVVAGQSLGGLIATHMARIWPDRFGAVLGQSTSYWWPGGEADELVGAEEIDAFAGTGLKTRFFLNVGSNERRLLATNRRMRDILSGHDLTYREYQGGHDYACWQGGLADGLLTLMT